MRHGFTPNMTNTSIDPVGSLATVAGGSACPRQLSGYSSIFGNEAEPWGGLSSKEETEQVLQKLSEVSADYLADNAGDNPEIPAGYTYLGQILSHDLTQFSLPDCGENQRTPSLDLDCVYGKGPFATPEYYQSTDDQLAPYLLRIGAVGDPVLGCPVGHGRQYFHDLPRHALDDVGSDGRISAKAGEPLIPDKRNDDHLILSQLHLIFVLLHNRAATALVMSGCSNEIAFQRAREFVIGCYRDVIRLDYAKKVLCKSIYSEFISEKNGFLELPANSPLLRDEKLLPIEFSLAAGRFGHSMIRDSYPVNKCTEDKNITLLRFIIEFSGIHSENEITKGKKLPIPSDWTVDWARFFPLDSTKIISSRRINPFISFEISNRKSRSSRNEERRIGHLDIFRSFELGLPSGQELSRAILRHSGGALDFKVMDGEDFDTRKIKHGQRNVDGEEAAFQIFKQNPSLLKSTPIFYYLLTEAAVETDGVSLGSAGSFITALTLKRALSQGSDFPRGIVDSMAGIFEILGRDSQEFSKILLEALGGSCATS